MECLSWARTLAELGVGAPRRPICLGMPSPAAVLPGMELVQRQRLVRAQAAQLQQQLRPQRLTASPVCGLKKEQKKLAKALKAHRKRLDYLDSAADSGGRGALAELVQELEQLHVALSTLGTQRKARSQPASAATGGCCVECGVQPQQDAGSSSSSESDDDCVDIAVPAAAAGASQGRGTLLVHTLGSTIELASPELDLNAPAPVYEGAGIVSVCQGGKCKRQGAAEVLHQVSHLASSSQQLQVMPCKCLGRCGKAPAMKVKVEGQPCSVYTQVSPSSARFVLDRHFQQQQQQQQRWAQRSMAGSPQDA